MSRQISAQTAEKLLRVLVFTLVLSVMSASMFNIVLPQISAEYHLPIAQVSWVSSVYTLIYALGTVTYGKLADTYRLKNLLTVGLTVFAFGSLLGLVSPTFWLLLVARGVQAAGAAVIPATAMLIPVRYFSIERRGAALGMTAVGLALGSALAPVVSAVIVAIANWRWLFCLTLLTLLLLPFYRRYLEDEEGVPQHFDWIGALLLAAAASLLLLGVTNGGWFAPAGILALVLFILRISLAAEPLVQPQLLTNGRYTMGLAIAFLANGMGFALGFLSPLLLAEVYHLSSSWVGFALVPAALASAIFGRRGGKLADVKGNAFLFTVASGMLIASYILLSTFIAVSPQLIAVLLMLGSVGLSFLQVVLANALSRTLQKEQVGVGMGLYSMLNFIAGSVGAVMYGKAVDLGSPNRWNLLMLSSGGIVYSNIYLALALLQIGLLLLYLFVFRKAEGPTIQAAR